MSLASSYPITEKRNIKPEMQVITINGINSPFAVLIPKPMPTVAKAVIAREIITKTRPNEVPEPYSDSALLSANPMITPPRPNMITKPM